MPLRDTTPVTLPVVLTLADPQSVALVDGDELVVEERVKCGVAESVRVPTTERVNDGVAELHTDGVADTLAVADDVELRQPVDVGEGVADPPVGERDWIADPEPLRLAVAHADGDAVVDGERELDGDADSDAAAVAVLLRMVGDTLPVVEWEGESEDESDRVGVAVEQPDCVGVGELELHRDASALAVDDGESDAQ